MTRLFSSLLIFLFTLCAASWAGAAGSIKTDINGHPLYWEGPIVFNPEHGELKAQVYGHEASVQMVEEAFATWLSIPGVTLSAIRGGELNDGGDVNAGNFAEYLDSSAASCYDGNPDTPCTTPVVFDEDGEIIDAIYGECARFNILAFAGFQDNTDAAGRPEDAVLRRGQALFSGACIEPLVQKSGCGPCVRTLGDQEIRTIMIHEIGHLMGMDHAQVNPESYRTCGSAVCPREVSEDLPTMFPILLEGAEMGTLHEDDIQYFTRLYGSDAALESTCSVSGTVYQQDGVTELRGVEVVARNADPSLEKTDALAFVSGAQAPRQNGQCKGDCGQYLITGLAPGETYKLCAQKIDSHFVGGSGMEPLDTPLQGFADGCIPEISLACVCDASGCSQFENQNIVTNHDNLSGSSNLAQDFSSASGGCSLAKPSVGAWPSLQRVAIRIVEKKFSVGP